jgi:transcriptional regulator with XRE-family HTH domain
MPVRSAVIAPPEVIAARVRAALAYSTFSQSEVIARSGIGIATLRRIRLEQNARGASVEELWRLADACEVPRSWLIDGVWDDSEHAETAVLPRLDERSQEERLAIIEAHVQALLELTPHAGELAANGVAKPDARRKSRARNRDV